MSKSYRSVGKLGQSLVGGFAAFFILNIIFLSTMQVHYGAMDWPYYLWALPRTAGLSLLAGLVVSLFWPLRGYWFIPLGVIVGLFGAVIYVAIAT